MKYCGILLLVVLLPLAMFAQQEPGLNKMSLGANLEVSLPVGDFSDIAGTGFGGNVKFQYGTAFRGAFTATLGYLSWASKEYTDGSIKPSAFSFFVGGKYYFAAGLYGSLEGGLYFVSYTVEGARFGAQGNTSRFMMPIGLGFQKSGFEVGVRYFMFDTEFNNFSFTVGYNFLL